MTVGATMATTVRRNSELWMAILSRPLSTQWGARPRDRRIENMDRVEMLEAIPSVSGMTSVRIMGAGASQTGCDLASSKRITGLVCSSPRHFGIASPNADRAAPKKDVCLRSPGAPWLSKWRGVARKEASTTFAQAIFPSLCVRRY